MQNVIWATGFSPTFEWIAISGLLDKKGHPIHNRGVTNIIGLYFLGQPWQHTRGSALLLGVGGDAAYIASRLKQ